MSISVTPNDSLVHEDVDIVISNLKGYQIYRVELRLKHPIGIYRSFAVFKTDVTGTIYVSDCSPIRGTYTGIRPMGLFESIEPTDSVRFGDYCKCTPPIPFEYELRVLDAQQNLVCQTSFTKRLQHVLVERIDIEEPITGTLFKPPGDGPFPAIIDISGTGGGINEQKAAALASRGFCTLSLAFFQYKNLPETLTEVEVSYFEKAIQYMKSLPFTSQKLGFQGVSFGATLVVYLATRFPEINAVVSINGTSSLDTFAHISENGKPVEFSSLPENGKHLEFLNSTLVYKNCILNVKETKESRMKLENTNPETAFRFLMALDDLSTPTVQVANILGNRLRALRRKVEVQFVPGGHLIDPPCFPAHPVVFAKIVGGFQAYGGETSLHGASQFNAWERTIEFFSKHLGKPQQLSKL